MLWAELFPSVGLLILFCVLPVVGFLVGLMLSLGFCVPSVEEVVSPVSSVLVVVSLESVEFSSALIVEPVLVVLDVSLLQAERDDIIIIDKSNARVFFPKSIIVLLLLSSVDTILFIFAPLNNMNL